jgi:hypothetical protein
MGKVLGKTAQVNYAFELALRIQREYNHPLRRLRRWVGKLLRARNKPSNYNYAKVCREQAEGKWSDGTDMKEWLEEQIKHE